MRKEDDRFLYRDVASRPPYVIPVFIPHSGCRHLCVFCNQRAVSGKDSFHVTADEIEQTVTRFLSYKKERDRFVEIAFFGGNFLGQPPAVITRLLDIAAGFVNKKMVDGIRFSTRPDTIDEEKLDLLRRYPVSTVEMGVQSMDDGVLSACMRGHTAGDTKRAVGILKEGGWMIGLQMMTGLPGEDRKSTQSTAFKLAELEPDFARIYPTLVLRGSKLEKMYESGLYEPLTLDEAVSRCADAYKILDRAGVIIARMGLQATRELMDRRICVAGPFHPAFGQMVLSEIFFERICESLEGRGGAESICIRVNPASESALRGLKNRNLKRICKRFGLLSLKIVKDPAIKIKDFDIASLA